MATPESLVSVAVPPATRRRLYLAAVFCTFVSLLALGSVLFGKPGFPLDDSWIHQSIARNLALYGSLGYLPHQRSSGSTSLLWTVVLASKYVFFKAVRPLAFTVIVDAACLLGIALVSLRLALRDGMGVPLALLWALAPLADGNFVWLAFTGMEHLLFVLLSLLSLAAWTDQETPAPLAGLFMGLLAMTRPEGAVLPILLFTLPVSRGRTRRDVVKALFPAALLAAVPVLVNLVTSGALLPLTFKGRQWLYLGGAEPQLSSHLYLVAGWFHRALFAVEAPAPGATSLATRLVNLVGSVLIVSLSVAGLWSLLRDRCRLTLMVCGWGALHSALYVVALPSPGHGGRYQPFVLMLMVPLCARGIYYLSSSVGALQRLRFMVPALALVLFAVVSLRLWRSTLRSGVAHIEGSHGVMAAFLDKNLPGQTLAVFDIGRIGYSYRGNIVDLGGLTDVGYVKYLFTGRVPEYLQQHGIGYVVLPTDLDRSSRIADGLKLTNNPEVALHPLFRACSPKDVWLLGYLQTSNAFQCQELDRIQFVAGQTSRPSP